jgi:hypothetical protein
MAQNSKQRTPTSSVPAERPAVLCGVCATRIWRADELVITVSGAQHAHCQPADPRSDVTPS